MAADVVEGADVRMIQRADRACLLLDGVAVLPPGRGTRHDLDRDRAIDSRVARPVNLPHAAGADGRDNPIGTERLASVQWHGPVTMSLTRLRRGRRSAPCGHALQLEIAEQTMQVGRD